MKRLFLATLAGALWATTAALVGNTEGPVAVSFGEADPVALNVWSPPPLLLVDPMEGKRKGPSTSTKGKGGRTTTTTRKKKKEELLTLLMLVQDDVFSVELTFRSALPYVDRWAVINTHTDPEEGEKINELLQTLATEYRVPGAILHEKFVDESQAKNLLLDYVDAPERRTTFNLMLLATEELVNGPALRGFCAQEAKRRSAKRDPRYVVRVVTDPGLEEDRSEWFQNSWYPVRLWRNNAGLRYWGRQYATLENEATRSAGEPRFHWGTKAKRFSIIRRFESDDVLVDSYTATIEDLKKDLEERPGDCRALYSIAITYHNLDDFANAKEWYERRLECENGVAEETFMATMNIGKCMSGLGYDMSLVAEQFKKAAKMAPERAEPYFFLAEAYRHAGFYDEAIEVGMKALGMPYPEDARIWITDSVYGEQGFLYDTLAVAASHNPSLYKEGATWAAKAAKVVPHNPRMGRNVEYFANLENVRDEL